MGNLTIVPYKRDEGVSFKRNAENTIYLERAAVLLLGEFSGISVLC